ncbi:dipeptidase [Kaistella sp.]|uniref:dipeptidase n=1 Tax=Kaistella sp. TaxID=2782235 RepID=UPI002F93998D
MEVNLDLHCDLTAYLLQPNSSPTGDVRCSVDKLFAGHVKMQVMAFYSATAKGSVDEVRQQLKRYRSLLNLPGVYEFYPEKAELQEGLGIIAAVENASGLCDEDQPIEDAFKNLDWLISQAKIMYVGLTHHLENRFGGGNFTQTGLKDDGKRLIEYLDGRKIAVDLSHTSDQLAYGILNFIDQNNLDIPVLASHSNMRAVFDHNRNLPDELVTEIINRSGLIGLNFVKYFINPENHNEIYRHIEHAIKLGAEDHLCFGADFFDDKSHPEQYRYPFFFSEFGDSTAYSTINSRISELFSDEVKEKISHRNALSYFKRLHKI